MPDHIRATGSSAGVATVTSARPERKNALSIALRDEVSSAIESLAGDESVKAIVITGAGNVFSAGFDLGRVQAPRRSRRGRAPVGLERPLPRTRCSAARCRRWPPSTAPRSREDSTSPSSAISASRRRPRPSRIRRSRSVTSSTARCTTWSAEPSRGSWRSPAGPSTRRRRSRCVWCRRSWRRTSWSGARPVDGGSLTRVPRELLMRTRQKIIRRAGQHPRRNVDL